MTDNPMTAEDLHGLLGENAARWPGLGLTVDRDGDHVGVYWGSELIGITGSSLPDRGQQVYRAVLGTDADGTWITSDPYPPGFMPPDPLYVQEMERKRRPSQRTAAKDTAAQDAADAADVVELALSEYGPGSPETRGALVAADLALAVAQAIGCTTGDIEVARQRKSGPGPHSAP